MESRLCGRRNTFATFPEDALQFSWQAHVSCCVFFANRIGRAASSADSVVGVAFCEMC